MYCVLVDLPSFKAGLVISDSLFRQMTNEMVQSFIQKLRTNSRTKMAALCFLFFF